MKPRDSFVLVLTLFLLALLLASGSALSAMGTVEAVAGGRLAATLEHQLAVESFLTCFPSLVRADPSPPTAKTAAEDVRHFEVTVGKCLVECQARPEGRKLFVRNLAGEDASSRLRDIARTNGLPEEDIVPIPVAPAADGRTVGTFAWFDQLIRTTQFEEVFRWGMPTDESERSQAKAWSDLLTFWRPQQGAAYSLEIQTKIDSDTRCWYVVMAIEGERAKVLHRSAVP